MPGLSAEAQQTIRSSLEASTQGTGVPGLVFCAVDKSGTYLAESSAGYHGLNTKKTPMSMDSVFYIASCTKMITGVACMQLAEQGKLDLDSPQQLYELCPELESIKVIDDSGKLVDRKGDITARMLLTHTAGFGYTFFNEKLRDFSRPTGFDEFSGDKKDYLMMPLVNQPGTRWEYGIGIDWAGIVVERITGTTLDNYFRDEIFSPLGMKNIGFHPNQTMRENLVSSHQRAGDRTFESDHLLRRSIIMADEPSAAENTFEAGGAGCFAQPNEYCQIIAALLNDGTSPTTGAQILKPATVEQMFTNQLPQFPNFGRQGIPDAKPNLTNPIPDLYPQGQAPQGWGLTFMMTQEPGATGRGRNTAHWSGIVNLHWWCDREKGVGGMVAGQILPFGDLNVAGAFVACEKAVYDGLEGAQT